MHDAKYVFVTDMAGPLPTRQEIDNGTVLNGVTRSGFETTPRIVDVSDASSLCPRSMTGRHTRRGIPTISLPGNPLTEGTSGVLLVLPEGDVPGRPLEAQTLIVAQVGRPQRDGDGVTRQTVTVALDAEPRHGVVPPAAPK